MDGTGRLLASFAACLPPEVAARIVSVSDGRGAGLRGVGRARRGARRTIRHRGRVLFWSARGHDRGTAPTTGARARFGGELRARPHADGGATWRSAGAGGPPPASTRLARPTDAAGNRFAA